MKAFKATCKCGCQIIYEGHLPPKIHTCMKCGAGVEMYRGEPEVEAPVVDDNPVQTKATVTQKGKRGRPAKVKSYDVVKKQRGRPKKIQASA